MDVETFVDVTSSVDSRNTEILLAQNSTPQVSIVIPCLNEARSIGICVGKAMAALGRACVRGEVIVADNGSSDGSIEIAERCGARVIRVAVRGYGNALRKGIEDARGQFVMGRRR
jgi:glycosyltransferase involved in cell wall biosynthesis